MCGIWLYFDENGVSECKKEEFLKISNRGPDNSYFEQVHYDVVIGFHRLSIMDITDKGNQPFYYNNNGREVYLMCNGEIYNYKKLKEEYELKTESNSDCEVILQLYLKIGFEETVRILDGVFALIVVDIVDNDVELFVARDPLGVRPLFWNRTMKFSSEIKGLMGNEEVEVFPPGYILHYKNDDYSMVRYYNVRSITISKNNDYENICKNIRELFVNAVRKRLMSDRHQGSLLSGGLDSSLVASIVAREIYPIKLRTFAVGMEGGTDFKYAKQVAEHIGSIHTEVVFTVDEGLTAIEEVIYALESYDITTIRASIGQFLLAKHIREKTNIKVVHNGDGSDELVMGYLYFHKNPTSEDAQEETLRLLEEIHMFDVLRVDRTISYHGLEARVPFLDRDFVNYYVSIDPKYKVPYMGMEKYLLRYAFSKEKLLPDSVLWRTKEALSDGVSSKENPWHLSLRKHIEDLVSEDEMKNAGTVYPHNTPQTKEAYYYRRIFSNLFEPRYDNVISHYWLPKWCGEIVDPSARVLSVY